MVAEVEACLHMQGAMEDLKVGVEGILAGEEGHAYLLLVAAVLDMLLHVEMEPAGEF